MVIVLTPKKLRQFETQTLPHFCAFWVNIPNNFGDLPLLVMLDDNLLMFTAIDENLLLSKLGPL
jgi:hypothetical protein